MDEKYFESLDDIDFEDLEEELAKIDPAELRYLSQLLSKNVPEVKKIIKNVLEEPISEETKKRLKPPLKPKLYQPIAPPRKRNRRQQLLRRYDPYPPQNIRNLTDYQNEIMDLYNDKTTEGVEKKKGRRYIWWRFVKKTKQQNLWKKIGENVHKSFYIRHYYSYKLRNIENGDFLDYYQNKGSPWMQTYAEAENWLSKREAIRLDPDKIERPNTKWIFDHHFNVDIESGKTFGMVFGIFFGSLLLLGIAAHVADAYFKNQRSKGKR